MASLAKMPVGFVSHGAPTLALDADKGADLARWAAAMPRPRAILVISAHWLRAPATLGTVMQAPLYYDFYGFPDALYEIEYAYRPAPPVADRVAALLGGAVDRAERPLDHGVWVPLLHMFPDADVPVLQLSLPIADGASGLAALGERLAPLRAEGVLILGSGGLVHNLSAVDWADPNTPAPWAAGFDRWLRDALAAGDLAALLDWERQGPDAQRAHPTWEHLAPLFVALGASGGDPARFPVEGFEYGTLSRRCVQWG